MRTTPEAIDLQATFAQMLAGGDGACVMEVSSHALELHRADAIHWAVAVFTNLTRDHLDFHPTMEEYFLAKRRLFSAAPGVRIVERRRPVRAAAGRASSPAPSPSGSTARTRRCARRTCRRGLDGSTFTAAGRGWRTALPGRFNVLNALCAIAVCRALGAGDEDLAAALPQAAPAPGRLEPVSEGQDFAVLVDYAHTPDSLENVLQAARGVTRERVIVVFGAGGDRDRGKRPGMGEIGARLADVAIVTSDNPRSEDPAAIIAEVLAGVPAGLAAKVETIEDRAAAIASAVERAAPGDVVVIAGKGHEQGQEFADGRKLPFDDASVARAALRGAVRAR